MIISFDIDNTLIPYSDEFEVEDKKLVSKILRAEHIRKGTINLFKELENKGHSIWIYTTSFRSIFNIKRTFKSYGLNPVRIINESINQEHLKKHNCKASKNPKLFGIDIHIDDSEGVKIEGEKYGFKTIIIRTDEKNWTNQIIKRVEALDMKLDWHFEELVINLITLKSSPKRQIEICGYGDTETEIVNDFDSYYTRTRQKFIDYGYINKSEDNKLLKLNDFIERKIADSGDDFWDGLDTHEDWNIIRTLAEEVLIEMNKNNLRLEVKHISQTSEDDKITVIRTETKLTGK